MGLAQGGHNLGLTGFLHVKAQVRKPVPPICPRSPQQQQEHGGGQDQRPAGQEFQDFQEMGPGVLREVQDLPPLSIAGGKF